MSVQTLEYSRANPSPRYRELGRQYALMHAEETDPANPEMPGLFLGLSLVPHVEDIKRLIDRTGSRTVLDYGSGKGLQYSRVRLEGPDGKTFSVPEFWGVKRIACFDPGVPEFSTMPAESFDGVVCTDVLEHCPEDDLPWILAEMLSKARRFVFATVALYPALKTLPSGENAHCTLKPVDWWKSFLARAVAGRPELATRFELHHYHTGAPGTGLPPKLVIEHLPG